MPELLTAAGAILVVAGIAGTVLPLLPGTPLVFAGLLLAAWGDGFERVGWPTLIVLGLLLAVAAKMAIVFAMVGLFTLAWVI